MGRSGTTLFQQRRTMKSECVRAHVTARICIFWITIWICGGMIANWIFILGQWSSKWAMGGPLNGEEHNEAHIVGGQWNNYWVNLTHYSKNMVQCTQYKRKENKHISGQSVTVYIVISLILDTCRDLVCFGNEHSVSNCYLFKTLWIIPYFLNLDF